MKVHIKQDYLCGECGDIMIKSFKVIGCMTEKCSQYGIWYKNPVVEIELEPVGERDDLWSEVFEN